MHLNSLKRIPYIGHAKCTLCLYSMPVLYACRTNVCAQLMVDLNLERSTWQLLNALYSDRIHTQLQEQDDWEQETMATDLIVSSMERKGSSKHALEVEVKKVFYCHPVLCVLSEGVRLT